MCMCAAPNVNGQPGYSWDGRNVSTRPVDPPDLMDHDLLLYDEPGRCGGMDSHCHHYRLVRNIGYELLVRHGGGQERMRLSLPRGFSFDAMDSNARYWMFNAMHHAARNAASEAANRTARRYSEAFADGRLKKRKSSHGTRVWIEQPVAQPPREAVEVSA